jgi:hypothetical protein
MLVNTQTEIKFNFFTFLTGIIEISLGLAETWSESQIICAIATVAKLFLTVVIFITPILLNLVLKVVLYALQEIEIILFQLDKLISEYLERELKQYFSILQLVKY